jgi:hypothetical protein
LLLLAQQRGSVSLTSATGDNPYLTRSVLSGAFSMLSLRRDPSLSSLIIGGFLLGATLFHFGGLV